MSWPTVKASTTYVDSDTDPIWRARSAIKQNIDNVNTIIDEFNIASPSDNQALQYNSTNSRWDLSNVAINNTYKAVISLDATLQERSEYQDSALEQTQRYDGGFTVEYTNDTGVTTGTDSGRSTLTFPAGTYIIKTPEFTPTTFRDINTYWTAVAGGTEPGDYYWLGEDVTLSGPSNDNRIGHYRIATVVTFSSSTTVYMEYRNVFTESNNDFTHPNITIERIA